MASTIRRYGGGNGGFCGCGRCAPVRWLGPRLQHSGALAAAPVRSIGGREPSMATANPNRQVCFFTFREALGPIFSSAYLNPAEHLIAHGYAVSIMCLSSFGEFMKPALRKRFFRLQHETAHQRGCRIRRLPTPSKPWDEMWWDRTLMRAAATALPELKSSRIVHAGG